MMGGGQAVFGRGTSHSRRHHQPASFGAPLPIEGHCVRRFPYQIRTPVAAKAVRNVAMYEKCP